MLSRTKFHILCIGRNHKDFWRQSVESALHQEYPRDHFHVTLVNDASTDGSVEEMGAWHRTPSADWNVDLSIQSIRRGGMANVYANVGQWYDDDEVVLLLSTDDYLKHENVLATLDKLYQDPEVWMTYGNYETTDGSPPVCHPMVNEDFRRANFTFLHPGTFRAPLFRKILIDDLRMGSQWMPSSEDVAHITPMMEMAGLARIRRLDEVLYVYRVHPGNAGTTEKVVQDFCFWYTRQQPIYSRLGSMADAPKRTPQARASSTALICIPQLKGLGANWRTSLEAPMTVQENGDPMLHLEKGK